MERSAEGSPLKIEYLRKKFAEISSSPAWSGQMTLLCHSDRHCTIEVVNRFVRDWIRENFLPDLYESLKILPGEDLTIQTVVGSSGEGGDSPPPVSVVPVQNVQEAVVQPEKRSAPRHDSLKPRYTLESFVVGSSNQFAHAASHAVSKTPGANYNPLFIYGGVGLGKTHLLHAIGLKTLDLFPQTRVLYVAAERFMNEMIHCLRFQKMPEFRQKYRHGCDLLLVDDVQVIAGKERTQDEFFHTFNHLHDLQKQIVLTSDQPPRKIPDLEERLRSRFEWGLIADIQVPDLETRAAILKRKADEDSIPLTDEVALFIATHVKSNVRELEGALIRIHAFASLGHTPITVDFAKDTLRNVLGTIDRVLTVEEVQEKVADFFAIKVCDLIGKRRVRSLALPRQIAMYLCRKHIKTSYPEIGSKFGGKDHSTVVHAFSKIDRVLQTDHALKEQVGNLEQNLGR